MKRGGLRSLVPSEGGTLQACTEYLEQKKILYVRLNPVSPVVNKPTLMKILVRIWNGHLHPTEAIVLILNSLFRKVRESQLGAPDLIVFKPRVHHALAITFELKPPGGKQSPAQKRWQQRAEAIGLEYHVVESIDRFMELV